MPAKKPIGFIDFGCGSGNSLIYLRNLLGEEGHGIDLSEEEVATCRQAGLSAEQGNLLNYAGRNTAAIITAVDLLPEIGDRLDFEQAMSRMILAARNYVLIQHNYYDADSLLALRGAQVAGNFGKRIRFKPMVSDYLHLLERITASHAVCGFAFFGMGEARISPLAFPGMELPAEPGGSDMPVYRSLRVLIGRKELPRFRAGLRKVRTGQPLLLWERPDPAQA
ncbi:class I SAM-dependent methyltransferase [Sediminicoccus sp. KRV36]|uniref:class I SAM-dependent methyltransferase n=1 Tax=Sediminicoccus sp. KRV36 TaxID=3133721 RepID=UPI00200D0D52|nr:class I SAM-dependent methyltransferase [Sediminicoccus rosea]UPY37544.1 class I SAM-dependent methyltransferase [Sediminicoccus rosea]